ncbi:MAG: hypothetical protein J6A29_00800 [Clostridia bacterium]|nr:hypothetical protein [Clostridia bacterium]
MKNENLILKNIGLDLEEIQKCFKKQKTIEIRNIEIKSEKDYKIYKYVPIEDIEILLTNSLRLDEPTKKIENMNIMPYYLDKKNAEEYASFINSLQNASLEEIKEVEKTQKNFIENTPSKIKYEKDYLWQIYYIKRTDKYYMIVPLQETKQQTFIYLLKKKIENSNEKIYVPICNLDYENELIENSKINKLENYLFYFTNNWPSIYEVHNGKDVCIDIIGKLEIYEGITSDYKLHFESKEKINYFYEVIEALFDLQTELSNYFKFEIILDENAMIHFYYNNNEITASNLKQFYIDEIKQNLENIEIIEKIQKELTIELNKLKLEERKLNADLLNKQKQISTFLECKKTFFGRVKYYFKYSKKKKETAPETVADEFYNAEDEGSIRHTYYEDIKDLIYICKELKSKTILATTTRLDIQNLKIKIEILKKKIENASLYIQEIESHKKSIFEFWKFTNKDEKNQLTEGIVKVGSTTKIEKTFNLKEDLEEFGKQMDISGRKLLNEEEQESVLVTATPLLKDINLILKGKPVKFKEIKENIMNINEKHLNHREASRKPEKYLTLNEKTTDEEYTEALKKVINNIESALKKSVTNVSLPVYSLTNPKKELETFEIDPKKLIKKVKEINLYKLNVKQGTNLIAFTNIICFNNRNQTLPVGMDYSSKVLLDLREAKLKKQDVKSNYIITLQENSDQKQITKINITNIEIEK